jgi:arylsulfatase A-like enzyme
MTEQPNIILITADDLGYPNLGCYGSPDLVTPHIDSMAAQGVRCTQFYSAAPVCSPARSAWLTGRHPVRTDTPNIRPWHDEGGLRLDEVLLPQRLRPAGYATGCIGKWHLGIGEAYRPTRRGFDLFHGVLDGMVDYFTYARLWGGQEHGRLFYHNDTPLDEPEGYFTEMVTRHAVDFIRSHAQQPFFLYLAYTAPHSPMQVPDSYLARFDHIADEKRRVFAAMVACLDDGVGGICETVAASGLSEKTIIIFTCDHGWDYRPPHAPTFASNAPLRLGKYWLYEGGIRVPALVVWPGQMPTGAVCAEPLIGMDWFPTILHWAGITPPDDRILDGRSIDPVLRGTSSSPHEALCWFYEDDVVVDIPAGHAAVRRGDYKLVRGTNGEELYNLADDIGEAHDLADQYPEIRRELSALLTNWHNTTRKDQPL